MAAVALSSLGLLTLVIGRGTSRPAIAVAMATSVSIAGYSLLGGIGVRSAPDALCFQVWLELLLGVTMLPYAALVRSPGEIAAFVDRHGRVGLFAGLISMAGYLAFLVAARALPLAPVAALRESSLIFGTVIGAVVFREAFGVRRIIAATFVAAGIVALALLTSR